MTGAPTQQRPSPSHEPTKDQHGSWLDAQVDGRTVRFWVTVGLVVAAVTLGFGALWTYGLDQGGAMAGGSMRSMEGAAMSPEAPRLPPVFAYHDREPIAFVHPGASDPAIPQVLEEMMGSPVLTATSEIRQASQDGLVELTETEVVVNAPVLTWPGGSR